MVYHCVLRNDHGQACQTCKILYIKPSCPIRAQIRRESLPHAHSLHITTLFSLHSASHPVKDTSNPYPKPLHRSTRLELLPQHRIQETRAFRRFRRRDVHRLLTSTGLCSRRGRLSTVVDTPVVQLDILVQNPQPLVDHQRRQRALQLRKHPTQLGDDGGMRVVSRIQQTYRLVVLHVPCIRQWWQVEKAVVVDGCGVEDARALWRGGG
jgi:hypothetical protein